MLFLCVHTLACMRAWQQQAHVITLETHYWHRWLYHTVAASFFFVCLFASFRSCFQSSFYISSFYLVSPMLITINIQIIFAYLSHYFNWMNNICINTHTLNQTKKNIKQDIVVQKNLNGCIEINFGCVGFGSISVTSVRPQANRSVIKFDWMPNIRLLFLSLFKTTSNSS